MSPHGKSFLKATNTRWLMVGFITYTHHDTKINTKCIPWYNSFAYHKHWEMMLRRHTTITMAISALINSTSPFDRNIIGHVCMPTYLATSAVAYSASRPKNPHTTEKHLYNLYQLKTFCKISFGPLRTITAIKWFPLHTCCYWQHIIISRNPSQCSGSAVGKRWGAGKDGPGKKVRKTELKRTKQHRW